MWDRLEARGSAPPEHQHPAAEVEQKPDEEQQEQEREETHPQIILLTENLASLDVTN